MRPTCAVGVSNWGPIPISFPFVFSDWVVCVGLCARQRTHFSLLRQRKVSKRKASRRQGRYAVPCAARCEGATQKLALRAQTSESLIPSPLRCSALPQRRGEQNRNQNQNQTAESQNNRSRCVSPVFCLPDFPAVMRRRAAQGQADQGRACLRRSRVCAHPAWTEQRSVPVAQRRADESGSPFLCLLSFGEAKESKCAVGRTTRRQPR